MTKRNHSIALIPGDGIGAEVIPAARQVLDSVGPRHDIDFVYEEFDWSCRRYLRDGVHDSAPDLAGRGVANPLGAIWSAALMLEHLGHPEAAAKVTDGIAAILARTSVRTSDLGGSANTAEFTQKLLDMLPAGGE
jgi:Isocitrate/isopropylmalate dehydrogenase